MREGPARRIVEGSSLERSLLQALDEGRIADRLVAWARIQAELAERTAGLDAEIAELMERRAEVGKPYHEQLAELNRAIIETVEELGATVVVEGVARATYRKGYTRYSWPNKALEGYAAAHPEILALRNESQVRPSVKVELWPSS